MPVSLSETAHHAISVSVREPLPELASVHWRRRADEHSLARAGALWSGWTLAHTIPFIATAALLMLLQPLSFPVALISLAHAWVIPELYAQRGANVVRERRRGQAVGVDAVAGAEGGPADGGADVGGDAGVGSGVSLDEPEQVALGLLGDLIGHAARDLHRQTGLVLERGGLGVWLVGEAGALLVRPGGRRVHCYCVGVKEPGLPPSDRVAHLLLALRADEQGFTTVANLAFAGARWRVRRRLAPRMRPALAAAAGAARRARALAGTHAASG